MNQKHTPHNTSERATTGTMADAKLMPPARMAVNSWSALNRPNVSSDAVSIPIGSAKDRTNGINSAKA